MRSELDAVLEWHTALNTGDIDHLLALVDENVEVGGPRGSSYGANVVREWFGRANVRMYVLRAFHRAHAVVVEEHGEWLNPDAGEVTSTQTVATHFAVQADHISRIMRYNDLATALTQAELSESDEVVVSK